MTDDLYGPWRARLQAKDPRLAFHGPITGADNSLLDTETNPRQSSPLGFSVSDCRCDRCNRPYRHFVQVDGWSKQQPGDPIMVPDSEGDVVMQQVVFEPQKSDTTIRLWVCWDADESDVRRLLAKALEALDTDDFPF